jgi:hypothetical protein
LADAEKRTIALETEQAGATDSQVARARIVTGALFRWRAERGFGKSKAANLVVVRIADERRNRNGNCDTKTAVSRDILPVPLVRWSSLMTAGVRATMRSHSFSRRRACACGAIGSMAERKGSIGGAHLHPSDRPKLSTIVSSAAKESDGLTARRAN